MGIEATRADTAIFANQTPYQIIGGEDGLRQLVERFYDLMDADPEAAGVRAMHAADLSPMREALFEFLSGAFGGPALYTSRPNAKCMFSAHAPFKISAAERDQWMHCMRGALQSLDLDEPVRKIFEDEFFKMAEALRKASERHN
jgi:hemoglobin